MHDSKTSQLQQILLRLYDIKNNAGVIAIDPAYLADEAAREIDPGHTSPPLAAWAMTLQLRQLARGICGRQQKVEQKNIESAQGDMFGALLQQRYPCHRGDRDVYVLREYMTADEYEVNIARLSNEAVAKQRHSDALRAEKEMRDARGDFDAAA